MPGKILIVDNTATNRIVLKVKLAAACYQVIQAANGAEGLVAARQVRPDLILCASRLPDMDGQDFAQALRRGSGTRDIPLIMETARHDAAHRLELLAAGADDILAKPYDEQLLLARLRSLLRMSDTAEELTLREGANHALGLSEEPEPFDFAGRIFIVAAREPEAVRCRHRLDDRLGHTLSAASIKDAMRRISSDGAPEAIAVLLTPDAHVAGLQFLADLAAHQETRNIGVVVVVTGQDAEKVAAEALDRGAGDVIAGNASGRELALRLERQITRTRTLARLRANMRDGLRAAVTDPLTGLPNRRYIMPRLADIAETSIRTGQDFAAMLIDVDHFKLINDQFGHAAGDIVLKSIADVLSLSVGEPDLLARIGGEEFLVIMPETGRRAAHLAAKRLCGAVGQTDFTLPGRNRPLQVTVSIGVALSSDLPADGHGTPDFPKRPLYATVLELADKALYGAKAHGRNQVTFSDARSAA